METLKHINRILAWPLVAIVVIYQRALSPDHGPFSVFYPYGYCKFYPTCSEFSRQVLLRDGLIGIPKIIRRILNCRPGKIPQVDLP